MATKLNSKLLILYSLICGIIFANNAFCADQIVNKSSRFSAMISSNTGDNQSTTSSAIAEQIRAQRAAIEARDNSAIASQQTRGGATSNKCDNDLRKCIESTCGADYNKCATDSDTTFSDKLNACRKNTTCTAREFSVFVNEIKEDKKQEIKFSSYNQTVNCGNRYNDCIITECGSTFNKCLSKSAGDRAIAKCKTIADQCRAADSGITGRAGRVFGIVRTSAEKQIAADEKRLRDMRVQMRKSCESLGAMFDERSLDCVFTVNFLAGDPLKQMASKKLYAGSVFSCTPDWFGIDITTFKENAYRLTRAQTAASSAMLGSGLGTATGAFTSGAIDRAIDTHKAKNALEAACNENNQILGKDGKCEKCENGTTFKDGKCVKTAENGGGTNTNTQTQSSKNATSIHPEQTSSAAAKEEQEEINKNTTSTKETTDDITKPTAAAATPTTQTTDNSQLGNQSTDTASQSAIETKKQAQDCTNSGGDWNDKQGKCSCANKKGLTDDLKGFTCKCKQSGYVFQNNRCTKQSSSATPAPTKQQSTQNNTAKEKCEKSGGTFDTFCNCPSEKMLKESQDGTECVCDDIYKNNYGYNTYFDKNNNITYFDNNTKRCYYTDEALKYCTDVLAKTIPGVTGDKAKGCVCPVPYEQWQTTRPMLTCLKPL